MEDCNDLHEPPKPHKTRLKESTPLQFFPQNFKKTTAVSVSSMSLLGVILNFYAVLYFIFDYKCILYMIFDYFFWRQ